MINLFWYHNKTLHLKTLLQASADQFVILAAILCRPLHLGSCQAENELGRGRRNKEWFKSVKRKRKFWWFSVFVFVLFFSFENSQTPTFFFFFLNLEGSIYVFGVKRT